MGWAGDAPAGVSTAGLIRTRERDFDDHWSPSFAGAGPVKGMSFYHKTEELGISFGIIWHPLPPVIND
jgi:hypothetical protein